MDNDGKDAGPAPKESTTSDIWSQLLEKKEIESKEGSNSLREASIVFVGSRTSGKSTLIHSYMFKDKGDTPKPTTSLDYKYTRSSVGMSMEKDLSHFWELGGGRKLVSLMDICITPETLPHTFAIITVDLSKPTSVVDNLQFWLEALRSRIKACAAKLKDHEVKRCKDNVLQMFDPQHEDINSINMGCVPILIVAHKFDMFKDMESELLKVMGRTLRCIAHSNGASILYTGNKDKASMSGFRSRVSRHVLNRPPSKTVQLDHTKPLSVPAGSDSFAQIGLPAEASAAQSPVQAWCSAFSKYFPLKANDKEQELTLEDLKLAPEAAVDQLLAQKDEDLKQIKRQMHLKRRMKQADSQVAAEFKQRS